MPYSWTRKGNDLLIKLNIFLRVRNSSNIFNKKCFACNSEPSIMKTCCLQQFRINSFIMFLSNPGLPASSKSLPFFLQQSDNQTVHHIQVGIFPLGKFSESRLSGVGYVNTMWVHPFKHYVCICVAISSRFEFNWKTTGMGSHQNIPSGKRNAVPTVK